MSTDRELLEMAAKAAKIFLTKEDATARGWIWEDDDEVVFDTKKGAIRGTRIWYGSDGEIGGTEWYDWNPLRDDGDALRLAVNLRLDICHDENEPHSTENRQIEHVNVWPFGGGSGCSEDRNPDAYAATRRAIVRAAAEIGRNMP